MADDPREHIRQQPRFHLLYLAIALMGVFLLRDVWVAATQVEKIPYSEFQRLLAEGRIAEVVVSGDTIEGTFQEEHEGKPRFVTNKVEPGLAEALEEKGVTYSSRPRNELLPTLLSWLVPIALFFVIWLFLMRRIAGRMGMGGPGGGLLSIGQSKAKVYVEANTQVSFSDVAGVEEAKGELREVVEFLKDPVSYGRLGARMPRGILLVGPPGTGKTLLARARGRRSRACRSFRSAARSSSRCSWASAPRGCAISSSRRGSKAPCIIFIDELDALGRARCMPGPMGGHDEKEQTLNQLLVRARRLRPESWGSCCSPRPTAPRSSTRPCFAPAASTARSSWTAPTSRAATRRSSRCT